MSLQIPSLIARLPRPLGASNGKCQFSEVYGINASKKRKRYEVAAAIDGEGIRIYNVQFPKLVTSYAIPPQSSFSCPPLSVRHKPTPDSVPKRRTYCAIDGSGKAIQCFSEESEHGRQNASHISSTSFRISDSESPVVLVSTVPTTRGREDSFDIIVVHKDGSVRRLSPDLGTQRWCTKVFAQDSEQEVQAGFLVGFDEACKSLLRRRQDVIATILGDRLGVNSANPSVLMLVSHPTQKASILPEDVRLNVFSVPAQVPADAFAMSETQRSRSLMTMTIPNLSEQKPFDPKRAHWSANLSSGELSLSLDAGLISYDLSRYIPEVSSRLLLDNGTFSSLLRISPRAVVAANKTSIALYNTQYQSIQNELSLSEALSAASLKQEDSKAPFEFISFYPKLGLAVAFCGFHLFAFDLESVRERGASRRKPQSSLLVDAIGKGVTAPTEPEVRRPLLEQNSVNHLQPLGNTRREDADWWDQTKHELEEAVKAQSPVQFDNVVKSRLGKPSAGGEGKGRKLPSPKEFIDPDAVSYLLSSVFSVKGGRDGAKLTLSFWPRDTFQWLVSAGRVSFASIQAALRKSMLPHVLPTLSRDGFVQAIAEKGSVRLLLQVLRSPVPLDAFELATTLRILVHIARSQSSNSDNVPKTLTETPYKPDDTTQEQALEAPTGKSSSNDSETIVTNAMAGLNLTLSRLHSQPSERVSHALRSTISNSDALSIINHLRHSLAMGGHTSRYAEEVDSYQSSHLTSKKIPTLSLSAIIDLLNACIDAVGPSGWISAAGFASQQASEATLIEDLKSEISAALAGVEEATYLKGILREFIRCCETASESTAVAPTPASTSTSTSTSTTAVIPDTTSTAAGIKRKEQHNGAEIVVYDQPHEPGSVSDTKMLPLSLKLAGGVGDSGDPSRTKVLKATGEVKNRSNREMNYLKRKAVGEYSFERIIV